MFVQSLNVACVCFQESKLAVVDHSVVAHTLGREFDAFFYPPAIGTRGGIIVAWRSDRMHISDPILGEFCITVKARSLADNKTWMTTAVYGPQLIPDKERFLLELSQLGPLIHLPWIVCGDFNLVTEATDNNRGRANRRLMNKFKHTISSLALKDMPLQGRRYTWTNEQEDPTLVKLDRLFFSPEWEDLYPISDLLALSSSVSDHCPLLLTCSSSAPRSNRFRFEHFWTRIPGFKEEVAKAWHWQGEVNAADPLLVLDLKLRNTAKALRSWGQRKQSALLLLLQVAHEIILWLDCAQEVWALFPDERRLRAFLKGRCLALASLEHVRLRQRSRVRDLSEGDANSKYFHMKANGRRRKQLVPVLRNGDRVAYSVHDKLKLALEHFSSTMGMPGAHTRRMAIDRLPLPRLSGQEAAALEQPFSADENRTAIMDMPSDRAPWPDGFSGLFFKVCWEVIADDVVRAIYCLHQGFNQSMGCLNSSIIALLPKVSTATDIKDFRPICLIHAFAKIWAKLLARRLAPLMPN